MFGRDSRVAVGTTTRRPDRQTGFLVRVVQLAPVMVTGLNPNTASPALSYATPSYLAKPVTLIAPNPAADTSTPETKPTPKPTELSSQTALARANFDQTALQIALRTKMAFSDLAKTKQKPSDPATANQALLDSQGTAPLLRRSIANAGERAAATGVDLSAVSTKQLGEALDTFKAIDIAPGHNVKFLGPTADGLYLALVDGKREAYELQNGTFIQKTGLAPGQAPKVGAPPSVSTPAGGLRDQKSARTGQATTWDGKPFEAYYADLKKLDAPKESNSADTSGQSAKFNEVYNQPNMHLDDWRDYWRNSESAGGKGSQPTDEECFKEAMARTGPHSDINPSASTADQIASWKEKYPKEYAFSKMSERERSDYQADNVSVTLNSGHVDIKKDGYEYQKANATGTAKLSLLKDKGVNVVADQIASTFVRTSDPGNGDGGAIQSSQLRIGGDLVEFEKTPVRLYGDARFAINGRDTNNVERSGEAEIMKNTESYTDAQKKAQLEGNLVPWREAATKEPVLKVNGQEVSLLPPNNTLTLADGSTIVRHGGPMDEYLQRPTDENKPYYEITTAKYKMNVNFYSAAMDNPDPSVKFRDEYLVQEYKIENRANVPIDFGGTLPTGLAGDILATQNDYSLADIQAKGPGGFGPYAYSDLSRYTDRSATPSETGTQDWPA